MNTYGMAYITEANECHPLFIKEVFDRTLSSKRRKVFHDLNPKDPANWYYTDVLNFHEAAQRADPSYGYNYGHFTIADNMSVSDEEIKVKLKTYDKSSVWYKRDILGDRTSAEGLIYPMFSDENLYDDSTRKPELEALSQRYSAVDYGAENPCVFLDIFDDGDTVWIDREYYYDGRRENRIKTNDEYADDFDQFFAARPPLTCTAVDPSAASFIEQLRRHGYYVKSAGNDVEEGIRFTASLFFRRKIRIHVRCRHFLEEIHGYIWDEKARQRGEEKPLKEGDHCLTGDTIINTPNGNFRIDELAGKGGLVYCYDGKNKRRIESTFHDVRMTRQNAEIYEVMLADGRTIKATADHLILTVAGWKRLIDLRSDDRIIEV